MSKIESKNLISFLAIAALLLVAALSANWVSGQSGTIPDDLMPGEIIVVSRSGSGGMVVGITVAEGDNNGLIERTVVLGSGVVAQTPSNDGSKTLEAVDAYGVADRDFEDLRTHIPGIALSILSQELHGEIMSSLATRPTVEVNGVTKYTVTTNEFHVMCLTDDGEWTDDTVESLILLTPSTSILTGEVVDLVVEVSLTSRQKGTCATFICRDNFSNVNVQRRADVIDSEEPAVGGIGSIVESYYNDPVPIP